MISIRLKKIISGSECSKFQCEPEVAKRHLSLSQFADKVGATSIAELDVNGASVFAKLEWENPSGTVKDRAVLGMLHALLLREPRPSRILEYTGGSLGLSLASLAHELGLPMTLVLSESTPVSVIRRLEALECELVIVDKEMGFWGVMNMAFLLHRTRPDDSFLFQHENSANLKMHREYTGQEFLKQLDGVQLDAWVAAVGTGGTYAGVLTALRTRFPDIQGFVVAPSEMPIGTDAGPNSKPKFVGAGGLGFGRIQRFVGEHDPSFRQFGFSYLECRQMMLEFYIQTGLEIGSSAAANLLACLKAHENFGHDSLATVFPSRPSDEESQWLQKEVCHDKRRSVTGGGRGMDRLRPRLSL